MGNVSTFVGMCMEFKRLCNLQWYFLSYWLLLEYWNEKVLLLNSKRISQHHCICCISIDDMNNKQKQLPCTWLAYYRDCWSPQMLWSLSSKYQQWGSFEVLLIQLWNCHHFQMKITARLQQQVDLQDPVHLVFSEDKLKLRWIDISFKQYRRMSWDNVTIFILLKIDFSFKFERWRAYDSLFTRFKRINEPWT